MGTSIRRSPISLGRVHRLTAELDEELPGLTALLPDANAVLEELSYALRPPVHEGRVPSYGAIVGAQVEPEAWARETGLSIHYRMARSLSNEATRRFADGVTSWVLRHPNGDGAAPGDGAGPDSASPGGGGSGVALGGGTDELDPTELIVFDRSAASERDLVVVAEQAGGTVVQRHPAGTVRVVGSFGVVRSTAGRWQHQPPIDRWLDAVRACQGATQRLVLKRLLRFAVHDLGAGHIGALLVYHTAAPELDGYESRLPPPPPLTVQQPVNLAPLRHVLSQLDGAALFDEEGTLTDLGVRLVPSREAEESVRPIGGTRHTNARRYSYDEPHSLVIAVSEDGPVTVFHKGEVLGRSKRPDTTDPDTADPEGGSPDGGNPGSATP